MSTNAEFVRELTGCQHWLRAFVRTLVIRVDDADEVLQRVNLVLWQKADAFHEGTDFAAWARQVARYEVMAFRKERARDRHLFSETLIGLISEEADQHEGVLGDLRDYLKACLEELPGDKRKLIEARYAQGGSVQAISESEGRGATAVSMALLRIRQSLMDCIRSKVNSP